MPKSFSDFYEDESLDLPLLNWLWYWLSGDRGADRQLENQERLNEQTHQLDLEYQKKSAAELPSIGLEGYRNAGFSAAAAAAALAGGSGVTSPTFSSSGSAASPVSQLNGFLDLIPSFMQQKLINAQAKNLDVDSDVKEKRLGLDQRYTDHLIAKDKEVLRQSAQKLGLDRKQLRLTERLIDSQVGLNRSMIDKNFAELDRIASEVERNISSAANLDAATLHEYIKMSNTQMDTLLKGAQIGLANQQTSTSISQEHLNYQMAYESETRQGLIEAQTEGQNLTNDQIQMANFVKEQRLAISEALGFEVDAPEVTQVLEAMVNGDFNAISKALSTTQKGVEGASRRIINNINVRDRDGSSRNGRSSYYFSGNRSSTRTHWYPVSRE